MVMACRRSSLGSKTSMAVMSPVSIRMRALACSTSAAVWALAVIILGPLHGQPLEILLDKVVGDAIVGMRYQNRVRVVCSPNDPDKLRPDSIFCRKDEVKVPRQPISTGGLIAFLGDPVLPFLQY